MSTSRSQTTEPSALTTGTCSSTTLARKKSPAREGVMAAMGIEASSAHPPRVLVLYGSLRERSYSRLLAEEAARILQGIDCEVRWFHPHDLPVKAPGLDEHPEVVRLRELLPDPWLTPDRS